MVFHNMWQVLQTLNQLKLNHIHFNTVFHFNSQTNRCEKNSFLKFTFFLNTLTMKIIRFLETSRQILILNDGITKIYIVESTKLTILYLSLHRYVTTCESKLSFLLTFCLTNYWWWINFFSTSQKYVQIKTFDWDVFQSALTSCGDCRESLCKCIL